MNEANLARFVLSVGKQQRYRLAVTQEFLAVYQGGWKSHPPEETEGLGAERVPWYVTLLKALDLEDEL